MKTPLGSSLLEHLRDTLHEACSALPGVTPKKMFGCDTVFAEGAIFGLIWKAGRIGLKVPEPSQYRELMAMPGSEAWGPDGRPMSHWVLVPESFHDDTDELLKWTKLAHGHALSAARDKEKKAKPKAKAEKRPAGR
jgi:TfoX/Sxy family transcriptional regulator of competence genes